MAKTIVVDTSTNSQAPFLRGILARSLSNAGISAGDAAYVLDSVSGELGPMGTVTTGQLRDTVAKHLQQRLGADVARRYQSAVVSRRTLRVRFPDGLVMPFSRSQLRRKLETCGLPMDDATVRTTRIYEHLMPSQTQEISSRRLGHLAYRYLSLTRGRELAQRFVVWTEFLQNDRPLLLLIGGTAGSGKSTIATQLANRLEIQRLQSTDMLREVMRMMLPESLLPVLHRSSFEAWQALPVDEDAHTDRDALIAEGYRSQAELLSVACAAIVQRALAERTSLILEGVHIQPSFLTRIPHDSDAIVVPVMLAIRNPEQLGSRIQIRGKQVPDRRSERYLDHVDEIWRLQDHLLSEAEHLRIPVIPNDDKEQAVQDVLRIVIEALSRDFASVPEEVLV